MKTAFTAIAISMASVASAQSFNVNDLPSCSLDCFVTTLGSDGCDSLTDYECHCNVPGLTDTITPCVQEACDTADQETVAEQVVALCEQYGVSISVPAISSTAAATSAAATTAPASTTAESSAPASTAVSSVASSAASSAVAGSSAVASSTAASSAVISTPVVVSTPGSNSTATITSATPTPSAFEGTAPKAGVFGGLLGLGIAAAAVFGL